MTTPRPFLALLVAACAVAGCAPRADKPAAAAAPVHEFARSQALIDSGNVAYKAGDFENAARRYASAAVARPDDPAAYFGLGMALAKLGRDDDARIAYAKARALSGNAAADSGFRH